ncbi:MAG TPA: XdhC/CoxI family protein [Acidimicrobiales bacterium]|nr:XdhC/CoxI family protein [Acidimicrobiales bacterium]
MRGLLADLDRWVAAGREVAIATVVDVEGSGPRDEGATVAVNNAGEVAGAVSGGCVESVVVESALDVIKTKQPAMIEFLPADDDELSTHVGLTCGGTIRVFVEPLDEWVRAELARGGPVAVATVVEGARVGAHLIVRPGSEPAGHLGHPDLDRAVAVDAEGDLTSARSGVRRYRGGPGACAGGVSLGEETHPDDVTVFVHSFAVPPRMLVIGAVDFTAALVRMAKLLGFAVTVCDPRSAFATAERFPEADEVTVGQPDRCLTDMHAAAALGPDDAVCVLTHDHRFDVPAIVAALATDAGYIGVMGSRRTHAQRVQRLEAAGISDDGVKRLMAPIGLDLGGRTPEETAVAICAEIVAIRSGRSAPHLRDSTGAIH